MPQRDSCASALAPRLSPKARGLSKTQAAGISDASRGAANNLAAPTYTSMWWRTRPARFWRTSPIGFIEPCQATLVARRPGRAGGMR